jgi:hypothetical protein
LVLDIGKGSPEVERVVQVDIGQER